MTAVTTAPGGRLEYARETADALCRLPDPSTCRALRIAAGLTLAQVARLLDCSVSIVSRWERGLRIPSGRRLLRYAAFLDSLQAMPSAPSTPIEPPEARP